MLQPDQFSLYHPASEQDTIDLVNYAIATKRQVRVRGAAQSVSSSVFTDGYKQEAGATDNVNIMLDKMRQVTFEDNLLVRVQAGCNLGFDPNDPTGTSTEKIENGVCTTNGLFDQLNAKGLAIPNVTDAIHQTVGGFISTASSGGTISHSFLDALVSIRLIDGTGKIQVFNRPSPDDENDPFYAVGVSLGLMGIITEVTLQCIPAFNVIGQQAITADTEAAFDFFGGGSDSKPSLQTHLTSMEFARMIWWPYPTVKRLIAWQARTMVPGDYNGQTGLPSDFHPSPYKDAFSSADLPIIDKLPLQIAGFITELVASGIFALVGNWRNLLTNLFGNFITIDGKEVPTSYINTTIELLWPSILPHLLNVFVPVDGTNPPKPFWDVWQRGLANDTHEYSNNLLSAYRTEFWVPISQAQQVMTMLNNNYASGYFTKANDKNDNYANACYVVEILGAKNNAFWLSPSYHQDSIRIDLYSLTVNDENVFAYFQQFWDLFFANNINFRLHWGYYIPKASSAEGSKYLKSQYPMWTKFEAVRKKMDPHNIFVNSYWKDQLNLE